MKKDRLKSAGLHIFDREAVRREVSGPLDLASEGDAQPDRNSVRAVVEIERLGRRVVWRRTGEGWIRSAPHRSEIRVTVCYIQERGSIEHLCDIGADAAANRPGKVHVAVSRPAADRLRHSRVDPCPFIHVRVGETDARRHERLDAAVVAGHRQRLKKDIGETGEG